MHVQQRNYGIELLRIIAMFMIVVLHTLGQGGILASVTPNSPHFHIAWMLEITCFCAVNIYALISGYVLCDKLFRLSRLINLWLSVVFYTVAITFVSVAMGWNSISVNGMLNALFPISRQQYWYLSSYCGLLLFTPFLNKALAVIEKHEVKSVLVPGILVVSIMPTLFSSDPLSTHVGYSTIWLCILYLVGGWIKKSGIKSRFKPGWLIAIFGAMVLVTHLSKIILIYVTRNWFGIDNECNVLITYISPTIIISSIALFLFFINVNFSALQVKIIGFISPMALGVYIIHANPLIWNHFVKDFAVSYLQYGSFVFIAFIIVSALAIYLVCSLIDYIRIKIFQLARVKRFSEFLDGKLSSLIERL